MPISSMTGFARSEAGDDAYLWTWEVRSVNAKGLDIRVRVPNGYDRLDPLARAETSTMFKRGALSLNLSIVRTDTTPAIRINEDVLAQVMDLQRRLDGKVDQAPPRLDALLAIRGVVETVDEDDDPDTRAARDVAVLASLKQALGALTDMRLAEGERLRSVLGGHFTVIAELTDRAQHCEGARPGAIRDRLNEQIAALVGPDVGIPDERVAQEAAMLATKADVREEIDRLSAHVEAGRELLAKSEPVGRRLDFLCQELNREANTLCAKAADMELKRVGLDLKAVVDQLREQVQNVE